jgi:hypothetical protein
MAFLTYWHLKEPRDARAKKASQETSKTFKAAAKLSTSSTEGNFSCKSKLKV